MKALELGFFSIPVLDLKIAQSFYTEVMGWDFKDRDSDFAYIFANGGMIGSLELATETSIPSGRGPLLFFRAELLNKTLSYVTANGGRVIETQAMEEGARGYTAKVQDPSKNTIAFWAPEQ